MFLLVAYSKINAFLLLDNYGITHAVQVRVITFQFNNTV
jgi:hypothetical protein